MILVFATSDDGGLDSGSSHAVRFARELADTMSVDVEVLIEGQARPDLTGRTSSIGIDRVHIVSDERLTDSGPAAHAACVEQLAVSTRADCVIAPGTDRGNEVLAHVAATMDVPLATNCIAVDPGPDVWNVTRVRWGGSLLEDLTLAARVKLLTVSPHSPTLDPWGGVVDTAITEFVPVLDDRHFATMVVERAGDAGATSLADSRVVVSGGRGVGSADGFAQLEALAAKLGGSVGCSRVATNNGWRPHSDQVGQTGTVVAPELYIACGISGAIQHWVGMMGSKTILAINTDAEAPMVTKADFAVVGDLHEVVPAITAEIRSRNLQPVDRSHKRV